jgi:hypothetical protein
LRREVAAQKQYLTPSEENALADYVLRMTERGYPAPVKLLRCLGVFGPLKTAYRGLVEGLERGGANTLGKQHFTLLYDQARHAALTPHKIKSG